MSDFEGKKIIRERESEVAGSPAKNSRKNVNNNETENVPNLLDDHTRV